MRKCLFIALSLLIGAVSCEKKIENPLPDSSGESIYAEIEQSSNSKTFVDEYRNVCFQKGDQISLFNCSTLGKKYEIDPEADGKTSGNFFQVKGSGGSIGAGTPTDLLVAYYPYSSLELKSSSLDQTTYNLIGVNFPMTQLYDNEHIISQNSLSMVSARTQDQGDILFKNTCGILKLNIKGYGYVKTISLRGNSHEKISGKATISVEPDVDPVIAMASDATEETLLDCGENGVLLDPYKTKQFMLVVPPTVFEGGFEVTITDRDGVSKAVQTSSMKKIERSKILNMVDLLFGSSTNPPLPDGPVPTNEIWYTSTDNTTVTPNNDYFGATLVSNVYENGRGILKFNGNVTYVGTNQFSHNAKLKSITLPETVTEIGSSAFSGCLNLKNVMFPESLESIASSAFYECISLEDITLPSKVTLIKGDTFSGCSSLKTVKILGNVTSIESKAFYKCINLTTINIPRTTKEIGYAAFRECKNLPAIIIPSSVERIDSEAFYSCGNLTSVKFEEGLLYIGDHAFFWTKIVEVDLPSTIIQIADRGLVTDELATIYIRAVTPPKIFEASYSFGPNARPKIYVPLESVEKYKSAEYWINDVNYIQGFDFSTKPI